MRVCSRQGASGMHRRGFHYFIFILMVKRILLRTLISSRTAVVLVGIRSGSHVVGRSRENGHPAGVCVRLSLSLYLSISLRGSTSLGHRRWVCFLGPEGGTDSTYFSGVNSPVLGDHLTSWDRSPKVLIDLPTITNTCQYVETWTKNHKRKRVVS